MDRMPLLLWVLRKYYKLNVNGSGVAQNRFGARTVASTKCIRKPEHGFTNGPIGARSGGLAYLPRPDLTHHSQHQFYGGCGHGNLHRYQPFSRIQLGVVTAAIQCPNHTLDISLEDIVAPTTDDNYLRENPACKEPHGKKKTWVPVRWARWHSVMVCSTAQYIATHGRVFKFSGRNNRYVSAYGNHSERACGINVYR